MDTFTLDFIGIGAEKAATYWIAAILREHPEICFSQRKELAFFNQYDQHFLQVENPRYFRGISWYKRHFEHCKEGKLKGEYTPTYLYSKKAAERIKKHLPDTKLIVCLRDPVKRAFSQYIHDVSIGIIAKMSFEEALKKHPAYFEKSYYYKYLKNYFDLFPRKNFFISFTEDIEKDAKKVTKKLYSFLELKDKNFIPKSLHSRPNAASKSKFPYFNRLLIQIEYFLLKNKLYLIHQTLEDMNLRKLAFDLSYFKNRKTIKNYPKMKKQTEKKLRKEFQKDICKLEELLDKNLDHWK